MFVATLLRLSYTLHADAIYTWYISVFSFSFVASKKNVETWEAVFSFGYSIQSIFFKNRHLSFDLEFRMRLYKRFKRYITFSYLNIEMNQRMKKKNLHWKRIVFITVRFWSGYTLYYKLLALRLSYNEYNVIRNRSVFTVTPFKRKIIDANLSLTVVYDVYVVYVFISMYRYFCLMRNQH